MISGIDNNLIESTLNPFKMVLDIYNHTHDNDMRCLIYSLLYAAQQGVINIVSCTYHPTDTSFTVELRDHLSNWSKTYQTDANPPMF